jgi:hypothetical protein
MNRSHRGSSDIRASASDKQLTKPVGPPREFPTLAFLTYCVELSTPVRDRSISKTMAEGTASVSEIPVSDKVLRDLAKNVATILPSFAEKEPATALK